MAAKYLKNNSGIITEQEASVTSTGVGDAGKIVALDGTGKLDNSVMPTGIGADTQSIVSSENLAAGDLINIWNDGGTPKVRKADATSVGKHAMGFVLASVTAPAAATVYFAGNNSSVTGLTAGQLYLSTSAGLATSTAPSASGNVVQSVGFASAATNLNFQSGTPIVLA